MRSQGFDATRWEWLTTRCTTKKDNRTSSRRRIGVGSGATIMSDTSNGTIQHHFRGKQVDYWSGPTGPVNAIYARAATKGTPEPAHARSLECVRLHVAIQSTRAEPQCGSRLRSTTRYHHGACSFTITANGVLNRALGSFTKNRTVERLHWHMYTHQATESLVAALYHTVRWGWISQH